MQKLENVILTKVLSKPNAILIKLLSKQSDSKGLETGVVKTAPEDQRFYENIVVMSNIEEHFLLSNSNAAFLRIENTSPSMLFFF